MRKKSRQGHKIDDTEMESSSRVLGNSAELSKTFLLPILILAQLNLGKMQFLLSRSQSKTYVQSLKSSSRLFLYPIPPIQRIQHFILAVNSFCLHFFSCRQTGPTELTVTERKIKTKRKTAKKIKTKKAAKLFQSFLRPNIGVKALTIFVPSDFVYWKAAI